MRYLGCVTRDGVLIGPHSEAAASFEFECYATRGDVMHASGEITGSREALKLLMGGQGVAFVTEDGHRLRLALADRKSQPEGGSAHVVATGDLPSLRNGALGWASGEAAAK
jgi:hypothetical protein